MRPFAPSRTLAATIAFALACGGLRAQQAEPDAGLVALHQALLDAGTDAVVLNLAAHPDDESSRTNTILRRKHGMRVVTAYTTYGDGGQNAIGREIGPELAHLRVRETLAAAALSGVEVRWLGMDDFGFSKTLEETRAKWGDERLLAAMRAVVDDVDPDFVLTNHTLAQGHGHHRATFWAIDQVLRERAAAKRYVPPLLTRAKIDEATWIVDPAELEPARGETYARLAHRAWVNHVTQGPWGTHNPLQVGRDWWRVANADVLPAAAPANGGEAVPMPWCWVRPRPALRVHLPADAASLSRAELQAAVAARFHTEGVASVDGDGVAWSRAQAALERVHLALAGVRVEAWLERDEVPAGGDGVVFGVLHSDTFDDLRVRCGERVGEEVTTPLRPRVFDGLPVTPAIGTTSPPGDAAAPAAPPVPGPPGRFRVTFPCAPPTGTPEPRFVDVEVSFTRLEVRHTLTKRLYYTPVPAVDLQWDREQVVVPAGQTAERLLSVTVTSNADDEHTAPIRLGLPPGVQAVPIPTRLSLSREHPQARVLIKATITAAELTRDASIEFGFGAVATRLPVRAVDVSVPPGLRTALVRGPDDSTERALADLGIAFEALDRDALALARLEQFSTVLLDIRAYHHRPELAEVRDRLLQYCRAGGRVVAMYHKPDEWNERAGHPLLAPFPLVVGSERVTEEDAAVTLLQPAHALLQRPHALGEQDFAGWVQERGLNFPKTWDSAWTGLLAMKDTGDEKLHEGALLYTRYGRGDFVYCSLALYRQLRVGHEGALRLLVNLLAR